LSPGSQKKHRSPGKPIGETIPQNSLFFGVNIPRAVGPKPLKNGFPEKPKTLNHSPLKSPISLCFPLAQKVSFKIWPQP